jgi:hypothetical protein
MPVTQHPLHRSVRAALPHTAPASGHDDRTIVKQPFVSASGRLTHEPGSKPGARCQQTDFPWPAAFPLPPPQPGHCRPGFVRQLPRYYAAVRLLSVMARRRTPLGFPMRSALDVQKTLRSPGSRTRCVHACTGSLTARGPHLPRQSGKHGVAFGMSPRPRHPEPPAPCGAGHRFRSSIPGLPFPLSTLRPHPRECARMTRGRRSWLSLQRMTLSFTTSRRF